MAALAVALPTAAVGLAACGNGAGGSAGGSTNGGVAIIPTTAGSTANAIFPLIDGAQYTPYNLQDFQYLMYRPAVWYGGNLKNPYGFNSQISMVEPPVYSHNDTVVTLTLKPWKWSDGTPVTARDLQFFWNLLVANQTKWALYTPGDFPQNVKSFVVTGTRTVKLTLTKSYSPLWFNTNELSQLSALPQQVWDKTATGQKVGNYDMTHAGAVAVYNYLTKQSSDLNTYSTNPLWQVVDGPFRLKSFSTRGDIVLVPNSKYSGAHEPKIKELIERPFTSATAEFNSLVANTGLTEGSIPPNDNSQIGRLKADGYRIYRSNTFGINYMVLNFHSNTNGPIFHQLYVRQALQHLINEPQDIKVTLNGAAAPSYGPVPLVPPISKYVSSYEKNNPYPFSVNAAKRLLSSHGWKVVPNGTTTCERPGTGPGECGAGIPQGKAISIKVLWSAGVGYSGMMQAFQSEATLVGIKINLIGGQFNQILNETPVCTRGQSACKWDSIMYGGTTFGPYPTGNGIWDVGNAGQGFWVSPTADRLIADTETKSSLSYFYQYENYVAQQLPFLWFPWQTGQYDAVKANLHGFTNDQVNTLAQTYPELWHFGK